MKSFLILFILGLWSIPAFAYIGPAISFFAYLIGPVFAIIAVLIMVLFYPMRALLNRKKNSEHTSKQPDNLSPKNEGHPRLRLIIRSIFLTYLFIFFCAYSWPESYKLLITNPVNGLKSYELLFFQLRKGSHPLVYWAPARDKRKGLTLYNPEKTFDGLTIFSSSKEQKAYLINMQGHIVHEWSLRFSQVWDKPEHVARKVSEHLHLWTRTMLYKNGDLLVIFSGIGSTPLGYGMIKIDKSSNLLWRYSAPVHHDAEIDENGSIYTLTHEIRNKQHPGLPHLTPPYFEDFLVILNSDGEEQKKISFYDAFKDSNASGLFNQIRLDPTDGKTPFGDTLHANGIELITKEVAGKKPMLVEGHILVSFRNVSLIAILDPESEKITWATYGAWRYQHDPRFLRDGTVVMFDNEGHLGEGGASRVIKIDLLTSSILWSYTGTNSNPLYSEFHSSVDPLPNANLLITESLGGRLFEITTSGEIVWEYHSPWSEIEDNKEMIPALFRGRRFSASELSLLKKPSN